MIYFDKSSKNSFECVRSFNPSQDELFRGCSQMGEEGVWGQKDPVRGGSRNFEKGGEALKLGHHGWPTKKILGFRLSKKVKITLRNYKFLEK